MAYAIRTSNGGMKLCATRPFLRFQNSIFRASHGVRYPYNKWGDAALRHPAIPAVLGYKTRHSSLREGSGPMYDIIWGVTHCACNAS